MMYLTPTEATLRLIDRYGIEATLYMGDVLAASEDLRERGPFVEAVDLTEETTPLPDALLDWVSLRAYQLSEEDEPGVESESVRGTSITYARPMQSQTERRLERLVGPYQLRTGYRA